MNGGETVTLCTGSPGRSPLGLLFIHANFHTRKLSVECAVYLSPLLPLYITISKLHILSPRTHECAVRLAVHNFHMRVSSRILRARIRSRGMIVTLLAWIAARLVSSNNPTRYASAASWSAITADDWKRSSVCFIQCNVKCFTFT